MPLPTIAGTVRATFRGTNVAGQQWANVLHFRYSDGASSPGLTEITLLDAKVLRLYTGTAYATGQPWFLYTPNETKMIDATYYVLNGTSVPIIFSHTQAGTGGAGTNQAAEVANVLTLRTAQRGRRYRGRVYLPGCATTAMVTATGTMDTTKLGNVLTQARGLRDDLSSILWKWVVASYGHGTIGGTPTSWAPFATDVAEFSMDAVPDVQRRRKQ